MPDYGGLHNHVKGEDSYPKGNGKSLRILN